MKQPSGEPDDMCGIIHAALADLGSEAAGLDDKTLAERIADHYIQQRIARDK